MIAVIAAGRRTFFQDGWVITYRNFKLVTGWFLLAAGRHSAANERTKIRQRRIFYLDLNVTNRLAEDGWRQFVWRRLLGRSAFDRTVAELAIDTRDFFE